MELPFPAMSAVQQRLVQGLRSGDQPEHVRADDVDLVVEAEHVARARRSTVERSRVTLPGAGCPSGLFGANAAWWAIAVLAFNLNSAMKRLSR